MVIINTIDDKYFSLDGIQFAKIYQPLAQGSAAIGIYNVFDTSQQLKNSTIFNEYLINGVTYATQAETITALLAVVYSSDIAALEGRVSVNENEIDSIDSRVGVNENEIDSIDSRVDYLEENQITGVVVYGKFQDLPATGTNQVSYKVSNDPDPTLNGYYNWQASLYVKDYGLAEGDIALGDIEAVSGDTVFKETSPKNSIPYVSFPDTTEGSGARFALNRELFDPAGWTMELSLWSDSSIQTSYIFITQDVGSYYLKFVNGKLILSYAGDPSVEILSFDVSSNSKQDVTITFDGIDYLTYINGDSVAHVLSNNPTITSHVHYDWWLGSYDFYSQKFQGRFSYFRVWSRAWSSSDVKAIWNKGELWTRRDQKAGEVRLELFAQNATENIWYDTSEYQSTGVLKNAELFNARPDVINRPVPLKYMSSLLPFMYTVVGYEYNLYFDSLIPNYEQLGLRLEVTGDVGNNLERSFRWRPTSVSTNYMALNVYDLGGNLVYTKDFRLNSTAQNAGSGSPQILGIGDSTIDSYLSDYLPGTGRTPYECWHELSDMFIADGGVTPLFLGNQGVSPYNHEAHSGYAAKDFIEEGTVEYPNPFWDSTIGRNNFKKYMIDNSYFGGTDTIDYCVIQLGINDLKFALARPHTVVSRLKALISDIQDPVYGYPDCWIIIGASPYAGNNSSGWGKHFVASASYNEFIDNMMNLGSQLMQEFWFNTDYPKVFPQATSLYVDRKYGYPRALEYVSARDPEQEYRFQDSVHPDKSGYLQQADAYYATLRAVMLSN